MTSVLTALVLASVGAAVPAAAQAAPSAPRMVSHGCEIETFFLFPSKGTLWAYARVVCAKRSTIEIRDLEVNQYNRKGTAQLGDTRRPEVSRRCPDAYVCVVAGTAGRYNPNRRYRAELWIQYEATAGGSLGVSQHVAHLRAKSR